MLPLLWPSFLYTLHPPILKRCSIYKLVDVVMAIAFERAVNHFLSIFARSSCKQMWTKNTINSIYRLIFSRNISNSGSSNFVVPGHAHCSVDMSEPWSCALMHTCLRPVWQYWWKLSVPNKVWCVKGARFRFSHAKKKNSWQERVTERHLNNYYHYYYYCSC